MWRAAAATLAMAHARALRYGMFFLGWLPAGRQRVWWAPGPTIACPSRASDIQSSSDIESFNSSGYKFSSDETSNILEPVFVR